MAEESVDIENLVAAGSQTEVLGRRERVSVYQGAQEKTEVLNKGKNGQEFAVPFNLRLGTQKNKLAIQVDHIDANRIIIPPDVRDINPNQLVVLEQREDGNLYVQKGDLIAQVDTQDLAKNNYLIPLNDQTAIEVVGFDPATRTVTLHKIKVPQEEPTPTPTPTPTPIIIPTTEDEAYDINVINAQEAASKHAKESARDSVTESLQKGKWWQAWRWPQKVGLRWIEGGAVAVKRERLLKAMAKNNTTVMEYSDTKKAASSLSEQRSKGAEEQQSILERFKTRSEKDLAKRDEIVEMAKGKLRAEIINNILRPITEGAITNADQVREKLAEFIKSHLDDPQVQRLFGAQANDFGDTAEIFATDILATGLRIKDKLQKDSLKLEDVDKKINIRFGKAHAGAMTEHRDSIDKLVAWAKRRESESLARGLTGLRFSGVILNPLVLGVGASLATQGIFRGVSTAARVAVVPSLFIGAGVGAAAAYERSKRETRADFASHMSSMANDAESKVAATDKRREKLEQLALKTITTSGELLNGGGRDPLTGLARRSILEISALDLSDPDSANCEEALRRIAEIDTRTEFSMKYKVDHIRFSGPGGKEKESRERLALDKGVVELRSALKRGGMTDDQIDAKLTAHDGPVGKYKERLMADQKQQEQEFRVYQKLEARKAAIIGGITGLAGGLVSQEVVAGIGRGVFHQQIGNTALENAFSGKPINEWFGPSRAPGFAIDQAKELYQHPGNLKISDNITLAIDTNHSGSLLDAAGNKIPTPPLNLTEDGRLVFSGKIDNLPEQVRNLVGGWENRANTNPAFNLQEHLKAASLAPEGAGHETFQYGDWVVDVNSGSNHQMSMTHWPTQTQIHGFIKPDGVLDIDSTFGGNDQLSATKWQEMQNFLRANGWTTSSIEVPGTGNALDTLLNQPPDTLKAQGILETDQFKKTWHFHVLRPDIVDATGNHTHNELTLHLGGEYQVGVMKDGQVIPGDIRHGIGNPGELNTGGELHGGAIQSHLTGVPPQEDPVLNELIRKAGGLKMSDTVFVVDLTNGKQIMLPTDLLGNGKLPDGLYDPNTGSVRGIETIATAVLQKPDGSIINPTELFQTGKIPEGSIVHSLASERFLPGELPPTPPKEIFTFEPPIATEFTPPTVETPPIPVIPWAPRHPLKPLRPTPGLPPIPPPTYYSGVELQEAQRWIQENPRTHRPRRRTQGTNGQEIWVEQDGRPVVRDIGRERDQIEEFIRNIESTDPNHYAQLKDLESKLPLMNEQTRAVVLIPAWMEGKNLYRLLEMYTRQVDKDGHELNPNLYEINILVNRKVGEQADESVAEIERFKADAETKGRHFQINYLNVEFEPPFNNVGNARRVLTNLTLMRSLHRPNQAGPLYIESEDADLTHVDQRTVINLIEKLDEKPYLDAVRGIQDRDPEIMMNNDFLFLYRRIQDFKEILLRQHAFRIGRNPQANFNWNRIITGGWNTGFTAEAYALIGGYNPYMHKGEDMLMGELMSMARGDGNMPNTEVIGTVPTRSDSSPRRYILEVASGRAAYGPDFEDPQVNAEIRNKTVNELMERISPLARLESQNLPTFQAMLNNEYQFIKNMVPSEQIAQNTANIIMFYLGFKQGDFEYTPNGQLSIKNIANVQDALSNYRARHQTPRKSGERMRHKTPERAPSRSQGLIAQVNNTLVGTTTAQTTFEAPTQETVEFLRKIDLPLGQTDTKTEISGNQINMVGSIGTVRGTARFEANLTIDENGQIKVSDHKVTNIPIGLRGQKEIIERQVANLDRAIINQINWQIDQAWEISGFHITDGKLVLNFKKKAAPTQTPPAQPATPAAPTADQVLEQLRQEGEQAVQQARERAQQIGQQAREQLRQDYENRMRRITEEYARDNNISFEEASRRLEQQHPTQTIEPEMAPAQPANLIDRVNQSLAESTQPTTSFETPPQTVIDYLKTIKLARGAKIKEVRTQTTGDQISLDGNVTAKAGFIPVNIPFKIRLENDPNGGLRVADHSINLPGPVEFFRGEIEKNITSLNQSLLDEVNNRINPAWKAKGMQIKNGNLSINFIKN